MKYREDRDVHTSIARDPMTQPQWSATIINHHSIGELNYSNDAIGFTYCHVAYASELARRRAQQGFQRFFLEDKIWERKDRFPMFLPIIKNLPNVSEN